MEQIGDREECLSGESVIPGTQSSESYLPSLYLPPSVAVLLSCHVSLSLNARVRRVRVSVSALVIRRRSMAADPGDQTPKSWSTAWQAGAGEYTFTFTHIHTHAIPLFQSGTRFTSSTCFLSRLIVLHEPPIFPLNGASLSFRGRLFPL